MPMNFSTGPGLSAAGQQLGLGGVGGLGLGTNLIDQVAGESEDERRRRIAQLQQQRLLGVGGTGGSAAAASLFSPLFAGSRGY